MKPTLGALVITYNEETRLEACLRSLDFCDERVVVDSFSTDRTIEVACGHADHVYARDFVHHGEQKNWGIAQLDTEWVLIVDADEVVPVELAEEVRANIALDTHDAWWIRRRNHFFGREIRHCGWQRDRVLRLVRRGCGTYADHFVHEEIVPVDPARVGTCERRLVHHSYEDWESAFTRLLTYSTRAAYERQRRGRRARVRDLALRPAGRFFRQYVWQRGFADGGHGVALCAWSAAGVFLREAKLLLGHTEVPGAVRNPAAPPRVRVVKGRTPVEPAPSRAPGRVGSEEMR